jgi:hypothetical protein
MIPLVCGEIKIKVPIEYAENILRIQKKMKATRWELTSQYQLKEDGAIVRANKKTGSGQTEEVGDK